MCVTCSLHISPVHVNGTVHAIMLSNSTVTTPVVYYAHRMTCKRKCDWVYAHWDVVSGGVVIIIDVGMPCWWAKTIAKHDNPSESTRLSCPWLSFFTYLHTLHTHTQLRIFSDGWLNTSRRLKKPCRGGGDHGHPRPSGCTATFESSLNELNMTIQNSTMAILPTIPHSHDWSGASSLVWNTTHGHGKCGFLNILCFDPQICWTKWPLYLMVSIHIELLPFQWISIQPSVVASMLLDHPVCLCEIIFMVIPKLQAPSHLLCAIATPPSCMFGYSIIYLH